MRNKANITGNCTLGTPTSGKCCDSKGSRVEVTIRTVMTIDSMEMSDTNRALIVQNCLQSHEDHIVITHGTDTTTETAAAVSRAVPGKTIVLTGAMIPTPLAAPTLFSILAARSRSCKYCRLVFMLR